MKNIIIAVISTLLIVGIGAALVIFYESAYVTNADFLAEIEASYQDEAESENAESEEAESEKAGQNLGGGESASEEDLPKETTGDATHIHDWMPATCEAPSSCRICDETQGEKLEHDITEANYQKAGYCTLCGMTVGEPLSPRFLSTGYDICEHDVFYPYLSAASEDVYHPVTGDIIAYDFRRIGGDEPDATVDAGMELQIVNILFLYLEEDMGDYSPSMGWVGMDYYSFDLDHEEVMNAEEQVILVNYQGEDYEAEYDYEVTWAEWMMGMFVLEYEYSFLVPAGYDGIMIGLFNTANWQGSYPGGDETLPCKISDIVDGDTLWIRLKEESHSFDPGMPLGIVEKSIGR